MLRKYSNSRTFGDNLKLGVLSAFVAGMVNVASFIIFLSFSSNVTGYFAIFASELGSGNWHQVILVGTWIFLYFFGSFVSNLIVINLSHKNTYLAHALPLIIELTCIVSVGFYGLFYYRETLVESEVMLSLLLFAMGLQNGLTASISNFAVKTTHLTGATTDLGILSSMFTSRKFRNKKELVHKASLIFSILVAYVCGGVIFTIAYQMIQFKMFFFIALCLTVIILYDAYKVWYIKIKRVRLKKQKKMQALYAN